MKKHATYLIGSILMVLFSTITMSQEPWDLVDSGTTNQLNGVDFINADTGVVVGAQGLILRTTDGGDTWTTIDMGINTPLHAVQFVSESRVMIVGQAGIILRSDDGGETFEQVPVGGTVAFYGINIDRTSGKGLISGATLAILWTDDFGDNWAVGMGGFMSDFNKCHMTEGDFGVAFGVNSIFQPLLGYTENAGATFDMYNFYPQIGSVTYESKAMDGYFYSKDEGTVVGRLWNGEGFITQDINWGSNNWNAINTWIQMNAVDFLTSDTGVTVGGIENQYIFLETFDGGTTWSDATVNGSGNGFNDVVLVENTGYAVGFNGQIVKKYVPITHANDIVSISELLVYPNPASDKAFLKIVLEKPQRIQLTISDMLGNRIQTIDLGVINPGRHKIPLNVKMLEPGIYLFNFTTKEEIYTQKFLKN
jgi:photosystem II stability/assembly factor-like uncharacterized protein